MQNIENLLEVIRSKREAHIEFKKAYNKQIAFDFNIFNFFNLGENKTSEILSFFLNPKGNHGQEDAFLKEFLKLFNCETLDTKNIRINCEERIDNDRRIDIYIEFKKDKKIIAIENKIWAIDQYNQLKDYSDYLTKKSSGNYLLIYLNPFKNSPSESSVDKETLNKLILSNQFKVIGYTKEIFPLLDKWISVCKADNVSYFIKQFKKYLEIQFIGDKTLNMDSKIRELIFKNHEEAKILAKTYGNIQGESILKLEKINEKLRKDLNLQNTDNFNFKIEGPFSYEGKRIVKTGVLNGNNKIWVQVILEDISFKISHYYEDTPDYNFLEKSEQLNLKKDHNIELDLSETEIYKLMIDEILLATKAFNC